jgi:plasmid stabilization system protein ParE
VAVLLVSRSAKADLVRIGAYTIATWGVAQAERYLDGLQQCAQMLAENPLGDSAQVPNLHSAWIK